MKVEGYIFDSTDNSPISNATIQLIMISTGERLQSPLQLSTNSYEAWAEIPDNIAVSFTAPDHQEKIVPINSLQVAPDVYMQRSAVAKSMAIGPVLAIAAAGLLLTGNKKQKRVGSTEGSKTTTQDIMPFIYIGGAILAISVVNKILDKLGLIGSKKRQNEMENPNSPFKPNYYKNYSVYTYAITTSQAKAYAYTIHNAFGVFQDDYNAVLSVFNQMRTKCNVSFLADVFIQGYGEDLLNFLTDGGGILPWDGLSRQHLDEIIDMVNNLPSN